MKRFILFGFVLIVASTMGLFSQTSFTDDFNTDPIGTGWKGNSGYKLTQSGGILTVNAGTIQPWQTFSLKFVSAINIHANPYVNIKLKGNAGYLLRIKLIDVLGKKDSAMVRLPVVATTFTNYCLYFSTKNGFDSTKVVGMEFSLNPYATGFGGTAYFDDLQVGTTASKIANLSPVADILVYQNSKNQKFFETDIANASTITMTGGGGIINNVVCSALAGGKSTVTFDCINGASGTGAIVLTANGTGGFANNSVTFNITVEANNPPTIDLPADASLAVGKLQTIKLTGISDGNASIEQPVTITASSDATGIIPTPTITYLQGSPYATLNVNPAAAGSANITLTLKDTATVNNTKTVTFKITAYSVFNNAPTITALFNQSMNLTAGTLKIKLSGITDGDAGTQTLTINATGKHASIISSSVISNQASDTAILTLTAAGLGKDTITLSVTDNGGSGNNGIQSIQISFTIDVLATAPKGYVVPMKVADFSADTAKGVWSFEKYNGDTIFLPSYMDTLGKTCLKMVLKKKWTYGGLWFNFLKVPMELDITDNPYMSYEIYAKGFNPVMTHAYFYDVNSNRNNVSAGHIEEDTFPTMTKFETVFLDFRKPGYLFNDKGIDINTKRISSVLYNFHDKWVWPFTFVSGTVYIRNVRFGDSCVNVPPITPVCTINNTPTITNWASANDYTVELSGISNGNGNTTGVTITTVSSKSPFIPDPTIGTISADGKATLTYKIQNTNIDSSQLIIRVNCVGSIQKEMRFWVKTATDNPVNAININVDAYTMGQTIAGFGAMAVDEIQLEQYAQEQGCTMMRITIDGDGLENINDNSNPSALDRSKLNKSVIDFEYLKKAYALGVTDFFVTLWSPPAWMKLNLSSVSGGDLSDPNTTLNKVDPIYYDEYVEYMMAITRMIKEETGIELAGFCPQNEPVFNEPYGSAILDPVPFATICGMFGKRLSDEGFSTKVINCEQVFSQGYYPVTQFISAVRSDALANQYTKVIGMHYPDDLAGQWNSQWALCKTSPYPKEYWGTEMETHGDDFDADIRQASYMLTGFNYGLGAWILWGYSGGMINVNTPLRHFWLFKNFAKYVRKGAVQLKSTSANANVMAGAFKHTADGNMTIVLLNKDSKLPYSARITGSAPAGGWDAYRTSMYEKCEKVNPFKNGVIVLPPKSITTLVIKTDKNHAPTADPVADVKLTPNIGTGVTLTSIGCGDPTPQTITITAKSSNPAILLDPVVNYTSPNVKTTLILKPATDATGDVTVTIIIKDDGGIANGGIDADTITLKVSIQETAIKDVSDKVSIYPNPADEKISLTLPAELSNGILVVSNASGQIVREQKFENQNLVDMNVSDLPSGAYFINISSNSNVAKLRFSKK
jgi:O-glycosyl hydrolase